MMSRKKTQKPSKPAAKTVPNKPKAAVPAAASL